MRDETAIVHDRQELIRREMDRRQISLKAVSLDGGWETTSTVASYFPAPGGKIEPKTMSVAALFRLIERKALSLELLSLLLPDGVRFIRIPEEVDHDELATAMQDWLCAKDQAHHADSEDGREIGAGEDANLREKLTVVRGGEK